MWKLFAEKRLFSPAVVGKSGSIRPIRANRDLLYTRTIPLVKSKHKSQDVCKM